VDPVAALPATEFYRLAGWLGQFVEVSDNLVLIPDRFICPTTPCTASKQLALFVLLMRWKKADKWDDVARVMKQRPVWCIKVYRALFSLLAQHYRKLVQVLDYQHIIQLLEEWSDTMVLYSGCCPDVLFFMDRKPWKMAKPGKGDAATALVRAAGGDDVNLVQQAYYNGHYGFGGAKVQHVLQADGMCYSFTCPLRRRDAMVLQASSMLTMLSRPARWISPSPSPT
jgi:hypothetical protein